jgi:hypothetical protein
MITDEDVSEIVDIIDNLIIERIHRDASAADCSKACLKDLLKKLLEIDKEDHA